MLIYNKICCDSCEHEIEDEDLAYSDGDGIYCGSCDERADKPLFKVLNLPDEFDIADWKRKDMMAWTD